MVDSVILYETNHLVNPSDDIVIDDSTIALSEHPKNIIHNNPKDKKLQVTSHGIYYDEDGNIINLGQSVCTCSNLLDFISVMDSFFNEQIEELNTTIDNAKKIIDSRVPPKVDVITSPINDNWRPIINTSYESIKTSKPRTTKVVNKSTDKFRIRIRSVVTRR